MNRILIVLVALVLCVLPLMAACGGDDSNPASSATPTPKPTAPVVITLGVLSDLTGPAASALVPIDYAIADLVKYFNDENLIPGVELKVIKYDTQYDVAKAKPGYEWLNERGADVIMCGLPPIVELLKPAATQDKRVILSLTSSDAIINPPGNVFSMDAPAPYYVKTLLNWIAEKDWDYKAKGPAKIGHAGWSEPYAESLGVAAQEYCKAHPDQFTWEGSHLSGFNLTWGPEVEQLKDCDYVVPPSTGLGTSSFMKEFREAGGHARFLGTNAHVAFCGLIVDSIGYEGADGTICAMGNRWYNENSPEVKLADELLRKYHSAEADSIQYSSGGYNGGFAQTYGCLQIIQRTVKEVGPDNFTPQALVDTATSFQMSWDGYPDWGFTKTKRYGWNAAGIYEFSAQAQDIVRIVDEWLPFVTD